MSLTVSRNTKINALLLLVVAALAVLPLALGLGDHKEEPFTGADAEAETAITELRPDYEPWFSPLYEPPSGEIESALFALQAALGAGVLAYYFGVRRGRRQGEARAVASAAAPGTDVPKAAGASDTSTAASGARTSTAAGEADPSTAAREADPSTAARESGASAAAGAPGASGAPGSASSSASPVSGKDA